MAQLDDLYTALKNADAAGDTASAQKLAAYIQTSTQQLQAQGAAHQQRLAAQTEVDRQMADPTVGHPVANFVAGYGKAIPDMVRGVGQRLGLVSQADVDEAKRLDAPLMNTGAGMVGNVIGNIGAGVGLTAAGAMAAPLLPAATAAALPSAASIPGAAMIGGALGFAQPTATGDSSKIAGVNVGSPAIANALTGAGLGGASVIGGRALGAAWQGGKALVEPFTDAGRTRIAGRMIQRFANDPASIANVTNTPTITGALPTLAEQTGDAGLARLQDSLRSVDPQINNQIGARLSDNNGARVAALQNMAGVDGARDFAVANRAGTAQPMYQEAFNVIPDVAQLAPAQQRQLTSLLRRPAIQDAMSAAQDNAANSGANVGSSNASGSIEGMHQMKLAMDDQIAKLENGTSAQVNKASGIRSAQRDLVNFMESVSPEYANARGVYRQMSQPVNQMDIAANLLRRGASNTTDLAGNQTLNRNALLGAMRDEPALMQRATGRNLGGSLADVMDPDQLNMLHAIANETDRAGAVATAGNGPGSATAQRMASQNILRQIIGPTGLPASWAESALANTVVGKPFNLLYGGVAEPRIQQALAQAVLNPDQARAALAAAQAPSFQLPQNALTRVANQARRLVGVSTANSTRRP